MSIGDFLGLFWNERTWVKMEEMDHEVLKIYKILKYDKWETWRIIMLLGVLDKEDPLFLFLFILVAYCLETLVYRAKDYQLMEGLDVRKRCHNGFSFTI